MKEKDEASRVRRQNWIFGLLCGILIGGGAILPGISAGVLCVVFGLYRPLMEILSHPRRGLGKHWRLFLPVVVGWPIGFFVLAKALSVLFGVSQTVADWLFIGLIIGTFPSLWREAGQRGRGKSAWAAMAVSFLVLFAGLGYVSRISGFQVEPGWGWYLFSGALFGMSVVIPGMTSASILMALGLYQPLTESTASLEASVLLGILPGMAGTVVLLARLVSWFFRRHYAIAFHGILGIVLASTLVIIPTTYSRPAEVLWSVVCCLGGFALAFFMARLDQKIQKDAG